MSTMLAVFNNVFSNSGVYGVAVKSASKYLSPEISVRIAQETQAIETKENHLTIEALRDSGELDKKTELMCMELNNNYHIYPEAMTQEEVEGLHRYATNATEEIKLVKIGKIMDLISNIVQGVNARRDYGYDEEKAQLIQGLMDKGVRYERGEIDTSRAFDFTLYPKDKSMSKAVFENLLLTLTDEELLDEEFIDAEDFFLFGPFTVSDIDYITSFASDTWARPTDGKTASRLENFFDKAVTKLGFQIDDDLNKDFVSREILPGRRLKVKSMVSVVSGFAQECNNVIFSNSKEYAANGYFQQLQKSLQLFTYYLYLICRFNKPDWPEKWSQQPTNSEIYIEALAVAESWDEATEKVLEVDFSGYLIKLDSVLFEAQAAYMNLLSETHKPKKRGRPSKKPQLLLG